MKKKPKRLKRREYRTVGTVSIEYEANVMARSGVEAEQIIEDILNCVHVPKRLRVKVGKRSRLLDEGIDYFIDTGATTLHNTYSDEEDPDNSALR